MVKAEDNCIIEGECDLSFEDRNPGRFPHDDDCHNGRKQRRD